jgi:hypothetical protein
MYYQGYKSKLEKSKRRIMIIYLVIILTIGSMFFVKTINFSSLKISKDQLNEWVIGGIPAPIMLDVVSDGKTLAVFLWGRRYDLRNRLKETGIDVKIKNYYRPYFKNEIELETYIDQIFYDSSGYYNMDEYTVNDQGDLIRKEDPNTLQEQPQNLQGLFFDLIPNQQRLPNVRQQTPNNIPQNPSGPRGLFDSIRP